MPQQIFFKVKDNQLIPFVSEDYKYAENLRIDSDNKAIDLVVSFRYEQEDKDIGVCFWFDSYAIGFTRTELMKILDMIKDEKELIGMIIAGGI